MYKLLLTPKARYLEAYRIERERRNLWRETIKDDFDKHSVAGRAVLRAEQALLEEYFNYPLKGYHANASKSLTARVRYMNRNCLNVEQRDSWNPERREKSIYVRGGKAFAFIDGRYIPHRPMYQKAG